MALEHRKGGTYYYTKRRIGRRVVSEYQGSGRRAHLMHQADQLAREDAAEQRATQRAALAKLAEQAAAVDRTMDELYRVTAALTRAVLRASGYHQHKGQWRRRREKEG